MKNIFGNEIPTCKVCGEPVPDRRMHPLYPDDSPAQAFADGSYAHMECHKRATNERLRALFSAPSPSSLTTEVEG